MKKIVLLSLSLAWLYMGPLQAQKLRKHNAWSGVKKRNLLVNDEWRVTSTQQSKLAEFNGQLESQSKKVTISYKKGHFKFKAASGPSDSYSVKTDFNKTELGVVYFVPKNSTYSRITVHRKDKLIVVEKADQSMVCYWYTDIAFGKPVN